MDKLTANINVLITDMGNGMAYCSNCGEDLDRGDPRNIIPKNCPKCNALFISQDEPKPYSFGGSDF